MDSTQLLQWLIPATGVLIAALWGLMQSEISRLRSKLESLEDRVNKKADPDALQRLTDKVAEAEKELRREIREGSRDGYMREQYRSEPDVQRIVDQRIADVLQKLEQPSAKNSGQIPLLDTSQQGTDFPGNDNDGTAKKIGDKFRETEILKDQNKFNHRR